MLSRGLLKPRPGGQWQEHRTQVKKQSSKLALVRWVRCADEPAPGFLSSGNIARWGTRPGAPGWRLAPCRSRLIAEFPSTSAHAMWAARRYDPRYAVRDSSSVKRDAGPSRARCRSLQHGASKYARFKIGGRTAGIAGSQRDKVANT